MSDDLQSAVSRESSRWDPLVAELQRLREDVGEPSYAAIAQLVMDRRLAAGQPSHAARIARSTVYDCFRPGRVRVNLGLVHEIGEVLGAPEGQVDEWIARCRQRPTDGVTPSVLDPEPVETGPRSPSPAEPPPPPGRRLVALLVVSTVLLNLAGRQFEELLRLPVFLDMIGTAIAAMALGPWWGVLVGLLTNGAGVAVSGPASLPFALVNVVGALAWGYGVRRFGLGRTLPRFFGLNVIVAVACSAVAVPILLLIFSGSTGHAQDTVGMTILGLTGSQGLAVASSNLMLSLGDKMISGFVALVTIAALPWHVRARSGLEILPQDDDPAER